MRVLLFLTLFAVLASAQAPPDKPGLYAVFKTSEGPITARLYEKDVPRAVQNFVGLAEGTKPWRDPKTGALVRRHVEKFTLEELIRIAA
jgi:hypothetical protein